MKPIPKEVVRNAFTAPDAPIVEDKTRLAFAGLDDIDVMFYTGAELLEPLTEAFGVPREAIARQWMFTISALQQLGFHR